VAGGGTETVAFACNTNAPYFQIHGSLVAPSTPPIDSLIAWLATLHIIAPPGTELPAWWRLEYGGCRYNSLAIGQSPSEACPLSPVRPEDGGGGMYVTYPYGGANIARVRVYGVNTTKKQLEPGTEYELFNLRLATDKTVGTGACAGCTTRVVMILQSVELIEGSGCSDPNPSGPGRRVLVTAQDTRQHLLWQGYIADVGDADVPPAPMLWLAGENPGHGRIAVGFLLPSTEPARVEVLDVAGRRIEQRQLDAPSRGAGALTFGENGDLRPGLYMVRLVQAGRVATVKTMLTR